MVLVKGSWGHSRSRLRRFWTTNTLFISWNDWWQQRRNSPQAGCCQWTNACINKITIANPGLSTEYCMAGDVGLRCYVCERTNGLIWKLHSKHSVASVITYSSCTAHSWHMASTHRHSALFNFKEACSILHLWGKLRSHPGAQYKWKNFSPSVLTKWRTCNQNW